MAKEKNKLVLLWEKVQGEAGKKRNIVKAAKSLQRQAEIDVAKTQENFETAVNNFEDAKVDALENPEQGFKNIHESFMKVSVEEKKFDDAVTIYRELFEEEPRLLD